MRIIAGRWKGRRISAPPGDAVRPTGDRVREAWMSIVHPLLPDARVLDLCAGSGALGLSAVAAPPNVISWSNPRGCCGCCSRTSKPGESSGRAGAS